VYDLQTYCPLKNNGHTVLFMVESNESRNPIGRRSSKPKGQLYLTSAPSPIDYSMLLVTIQLPPFSFQLFFQQRRLIKHKMFFKVITVYFSYLRFFFFLTNAQLKTYQYGERIVDRMDFKELALKGIDPSLGPSLSTELDFQLRLLLR
jgi:hypothetical protein